MKILQKLRKNLNLTQVELAKKLSIEQQTLTQYEIGRNPPVFKNSLKLINFFKVSLDFLILNNDCLYPKNLKLLYLSKKIDENFPPQDRTHIEVTANSFLKEKKSVDIKLKQDNIDTLLKKDDFGYNLRAIRKFNSLKQIELATNIKISRSLLGMYESKILPSLENLIQLSNNLHVSMHVLATGEKLFFDYQDRHFGKTMLLADHFLSLEHQKFLIELMENIINEKK